MDDDKASDSQDMGDRILDKHSREMGMSLRNAMMAIKHPANPRFSLFHSIDCHWKDDCYIITCLKSADSLAHAMIAALLPYVKWMLWRQNIEK